LQGAEDVALVGGEFGALVDLAGVAGELSDVQGLEFLADARRLDDRFQALSGRRRVASA